MDARYGLQAVSVIPFRHLYLGEYMGSASNTKGSDIQASTSIGVYGGVRALTYRLHKTQIRVYDLLCVFWYSFSCVVCLDVYLIMCIMYPAIYLADSYCYIYGVLILLQMCPHTLVHVVCSGVAVCVCVCVCVRVRVRMCVCVCMQRVRHTQLLLLLLLYVWSCSAHNAMYLASSFPSSFYPSLSCALGVSICTFVPVEQVN